MRDGGGRSVRSTRSLWRKNCGRTRQAPKTLLAERVSRLSELRSAPSYPMRAGRPFLAGRSLTLRNNSTRLAFPRGITTPRIVKAGQASRTRSLKPISVLLPRPSGETDRCRGRRADCECYCCQRATSRRGLLADPIVVAEQLWRRNHPMKLADPAALPSSISSSSIATRVLIGWARQGPKPSSTTALNLITSKHVARSRETLNKAGFQR